MAIKQNDFLLLQGWQKWWDSSMLMSSDDRRWIRWYFLSCPVAVLPTSMSACCLACLPLWQPLVCLSVILSACVLVCLVILPVCHLLPSLYYSPPICLTLLRCLPVCLPAVLPVCLYVSRLFVCLSSFPPVYWSVLSFCLSAICSHLYTVVPLHVFCCCAAYQFVCLLSCLSVFLSYCLFAICPACHLTCRVFLSHHLFVCLYINLLSCLSFCQTVVCSHLLLQSLLPVLPVAVLPTSTSACRLTYLSLCQPLFCLSFNLWSVWLYVSLPPCLSFFLSCCLFVCLSSCPSLFVQSVFSHVSHLLPSFCYSSPTCLSVAGLPN
jgi:hypothetical protein